jgi:hypothetical protein
MARKTLWLTGVGGRQDSSTFRRRGWLTALVFRDASLAPQAFRKSSSLIARKPVKKL